MDRSDAPRAERRRLTHVDRRGRPGWSTSAPSPRPPVAPSPRPGRCRRDPQPPSTAALEGDVLAVAELAGVMGAKRTAELIPLCHPSRSPTSS